MTTRDIHLPPEEVAYARVRMAMLEAIQREIGIEEVRHMRTKHEILLRLEKAEREVAHVVQMTFEKHVPPESQALGEAYDFDINTGKLTRKEAQ